MASGDRLRIGELARRAGVAPSLLRYYEEQGLLRPAARTPAGYRLYGPESLARLGFIQRAKALGLSLREVRQLVAEPADPVTRLARLRHAIAHKLADIQRRLHELELLRADLAALAERLGAGLPTCSRLGDCTCWLPPREEVNPMSTPASEPAACTCCGCSCPSQGACACCGCPDPSC